MQYSLCHRLKQLNRMFKAERRGKTGGGRREEAEEEEKLSRPTQSIYSLALCRTPLLMKEEMKTRDEGGRRKRRKISVLSRLLLSHYASLSLSLSLCVCDVRSPLAGTPESRGVTTRLLSPLK